MSRTLHHKVICVKSALCDYERGGGRGIPAVGRELRNEPDRGIGRLLRGRCGAAPDFGPLISTGSSETIHVPVPTLALQSPLDAWRFGVTAATPEPLKLPNQPKHSKAAVEANLHLTGSGAALATSGRIAFSDLPLKTDFAQGNVESATYFFSTRGQGGSGSEPVMLAARVTGSVSDVTFNGYFTGPLDHLSSAFLSEPDMSEDALHTLLSKGFIPLPPDAGEIHLEPGLLVTPP